MRILPSALALALLLLPLAINPATAAAPAVRPAPRSPAPATTRATFAEAYREAATQMLATGCPYATWAAAGRHFLFFDPAGDGKTAEVFGDLATASRIAILVPGVDTTLADFDRGL